VLNGCLLFDVLQRANSMEIASESKLKLRGKLINEHLNGQSLLLKWELIVQSLNSSQECCESEHRMESDFSKGNRSKTLH
jgi:hypothetical protein